MGATIIIPAHDEEQVLGGTLQTLLKGLAADVQVLVVCNGCSDRTAHVGRAFSPRVEVIEIKEASKVAALNAGDDAARGFPRAYLDADVTVTGDSMQRVLAALAAPGALAAEPRAHLDTGASSAVVCAYYAVWQALHGRQPGDVGGGLYALSEAGRARFEKFPLVIADDAYVRAHFAPGEIADVAGAYSVVRAPHSFRSLLLIKTRSRLGVVELSLKFPELWASKRLGAEPLSRKLSRLPLKLWPLVPVYLLTVLRIRRRARAMTPDLATYRWERDESTR